MKKQSSVSLSKILDDIPLIKRKKSKLFIPFSILLVIFLCFLLRPYNQGDTVNISPELKLLKKPYKNVETFFYTDGGSLGLKITGKENKVFMACFSDGPNSSITGMDYEKLYTGATHYSEPLAVETDNMDTRQVLIYILRERNNNILYDDLCIAKSSGRWSDYIRILWKKYVIKNDNYIYGY